VIEEYTQYRSTIINSIAIAKLRLTISFNRWKANNDVLNLLGIVIYYLRDDNKLYNVVLIIRVLRT
jgi:hypothetical protein